MNESSEIEKPENICVTACFNNDVKVLKKFLPKINVHFEDEKMLRVAVIMGSVDCVITLVEAGADMNWKGYPIFGNKTEEKISALESAEKLLKTVANKNRISKIVDYMKMAQRKKKIEDLG